MEEQYYMYLTHKFLNKKILQHETLELRAWIMESSQNLNAFLDYQIAWELTSNAFDALTDNDKANTFKQIEEAITRSIKNEKRKHLTKLVGTCIVVFCGLVLTIASSYFHREVQPPSHRYAITSFGKSTLLLTDSSTVRLNDSTTFASLITDKKRTVHLIGEARFDVRKEHRPFVIITSTDSIIVTGTSFYVQAVAGKPLRVSVLQGSVQIFIAGVRWDLTHGETFSLSDQAHRTVSTDTTSNFDAWDTKRLRFSHTPVETVIDDLNHFYGVVVSADNHLDQCTFTGSFEDITVAEALQILAYSLNSHVEHSGGKYYRLTGKGCVH